MRRQGGREGRWIAKVNIALSGIYWHITWLTQLTHGLHVVRGHTRNVHVENMLTCMCTSDVSLSLCDSLDTLFLPPMKDLVLNRCFLSCIITLRPSLPLRFLSPSISPHPFPRSLFGQFNHGTHAPLGSPLFHQAVTLGKIHFFLGFKLSLCVSVTPFLRLPPIVLCPFLSPVKPRPA